jgi:hypothetical protein
MQPCGEPPMRSGFTTRLKTTITIKTSVELRLFWLLVFQDLPNNAIDLS